MPGINLDLFRGLTPGVTEFIHTSGGGGNPTNLASLSVSPPNLGAFEGDGDIPERQSSKKGKYPNDPSLVSRKSCEGSLVHTRLSPKPHDLGEMMSPPLVGLVGLDGMTPREEGGEGAHLLVGHVVYRSNPLLNPPPTTHPQPFFLEVVGNKPHDPHAKWRVRPLGNGGAGQGGIIL